MPVFLLWLTACAGHTLFWVTSLNVLYGWPLPHSLLRITRKVDILAILSGPLLFGLVLGWTDGWGGNSRAAMAVALSYVGFCSALGMTMVPLAMVLYWRRCRPDQLLDNRAAIVDVAAALGYRPIGNGQDRLLARLPGNQLFEVDFREVTLQLPRLPATLDGLTILHLTDLHFGGTPDRKFYEYVMERCCSPLPDLVAITGDIVDSATHHRWVIPVLGRLRWKHAAYAILGNHDLWYKHAHTRRRLRRLGMAVLDNRWQLLEVNGEALVVIGHEGPWFGTGPDLSRCPDQGLRLCLSHTPDNLAWGRRQGVDLMLAGHVHGGQVRLPLLGSLFAPSRYGRHYDCGAFFEPPTLLYVGRGLAGQHPIRFNCRPEVTRLTLRCPDSQLPTSRLAFAQPASLGGQSVSNP